MSAVSFGTSIASICAVVIFVAFACAFAQTPFPSATRFSMSFLIAMQRASVREAMRSSPNTSGF